MKVTGMSQTTEQKNLLKEQKIIEIVINSLYEKTLKKEIVTWQNLIMK